MRVAAATNVPPRSEGGQTLAVPPEQLDLGEVYYVTPGEDTQLVCTSDAPLQRVAATCSRIVGYVVTPFELDEGQPPVLAGAFRIPVASLSAGSEPNTAVLHTPKLLNAKEFPELTFLVTRVRDAQRIGEEKKRKSYTLKLAGELKVKDKTLELELPVRLAIIPFTWQTMGRSVGDLLTLRTQLDLKLADLGMALPDRSFSERIADVIHVEVFLLCNTMSPEKNLDPKIKREHFLKQLRFLTLLRDFNDAEQGYQFGRAYTQEIWNDAQALHRLALATLTEEGIQTRDLSFVLQAAQRANELTRFQDPALLQTLARTYFAKAELETALQFARQASEHLQGAPPEVAAEVRAALQRYEAQALQSGERRAPTTAETPASSP